ncbi:uncharacterized protein NEMAJ01_2201 [Nematocida major]|uniref:uncharacterized protein n=1 Tax=Nematocida major TaxID=1912982 RepID=UPI002008653E|nr:uncharacterized protein NEMAJ01_2201 [Nematocida major]KAH9387305.1 hypothetical protein NEMAJ01_2201 [Nematocida major]
MSVIRVGGEKLRTSIECECIPVLAEAIISALHACIDKKSTEISAVNEKISENLHGIRPILARLVNVEGMDAVKSPSTLREIHMQVMTLISGRIASVQATHKKIKHVLESLQAGDSPSRSKQVDEIAESLILDLDCIDQEQIESLYFAPLLKESARKRRVCAATGLFGLLSLGVFVILICIYR